jgi:uncharacterized protein (DUF58 family)
MRPSGRALYAIAIWGALGLVASIWSNLEVYWWGAAGLLLLLGLIDAIALLATGKIIVERELPGRFALGVQDEVELILRNRSKRSVRLRAYDAVPDEAEVWDMPWEGRVKSGDFARVTYPVKMLERGQAFFDATHLLVASPLRFWWRARRGGEEETVRVYPNYEPLVRFTLLSMESSENPMGIVHKNRIGVSREFHQLREYHEGDVLSQIDWKATSKHRELISREFEEQRDQNIILAVDCSRRMRAMDGDITQFDHCLNAMLLLAFIALRQGDKVGVMGFGGDPRWFPPAKGAHSMTALLNHLYDYQASDYPADFSEAAEQLDIRQKRRALVVVLTNVRGEDGSDLVPALRSLRRRHLVMLANLREGELNENLAKPVDSLDEALRYGSTRMYLEERAKLFEHLSAHGVHSLDSTASTLPVDLTNTYLRIKASGQL